jgi:4-amino-4-deoxy-L-arabinose transferase-like glycosyltransferase
MSEGEPRNADGRARPPASPERSAEDPSLATATDEPIVTPWRERLRRVAPEVGITVAALVLFAWGLSKNGYGNTYYAAAARSMTTSWKNFLFGSFDPGGWITTDKPPLALWLEASSARIFGYSSWSLLMPSVLAGAGSVWLLMATVRRAWGARAGRVAGVALALTPVALAVSRSNNPDAVLVLCLVAAAYATQRAISDRRPGWLVVAGVACGLGFLAKWLVGGVVLPGVFLAYFLTGPGGWWRRVRDIALATGAFLVVAGGWMAAIDIVPPSSRPFVGNSTNNTTQSVVFGYDGFGRLTGSTSRPGGVPRGFGGSLRGFAGGSGGAPGIGRLFNAGMGDQVMWLFALAALALVGGLALLARRRLATAERGSLILWAGVGVVSYFVFAFTQGTFHNYYVAAFAPAVAAFVGIGVELVCRGGRVAALGVATGAVATAVLQVVLLRRVDAYQALRTIVPVALGVVALAALAAALWGRTGRRALTVLAGTGLVVALVAPTAWATSGVRHAQNGTEPAARPSTGSASTFAPGGGGGFAVPTRGRSGGRAGGALAGFSPAELAWLRRRQGRARWMVAVPSARQAAPAIIAGDSVMAMGGFQGSDPAMTQPRLADLVARHELRFVTPGGGFGGTTIGAVVTEVCAPVDATNWGASGPSGVYDCAGRAGPIRAARVTAAPATGQGVPPGIRLGSATAVARLVQCLQQHGWDPTAGSLNLSTPAASHAISACAALVPAALAGPSRDRRAGL